MASSILRLLLDEVHSILCVVNCEYELNRLVQWAKRKKLTKRELWISNRFKLM